MALTREEVLHIAELAKLRIEEHEIEMYAEQLSAILDYAQAINKLNTDDIPPTASVIPQESVLAEDEPQPTLERDTLLRNAPDAEVGQFRVRAILE